MSETTEKLDGLIARHSQKVETFTRCQYPSLAAPHKETLAAWQIVKDLMEAVREIDENAFTIGQAEAIAAKALDTAEERIRAV